MIKEGRAKKKKNALVVVDAAVADCGQINLSRSIPRLDVVDVLDFPEIVQTEWSDGEEVEVLYYWKCPNLRLPLEVVNVGCVTDIAAVKMTADWSESGSRLDDTVAAETTTMMMMMTKKKPPKPMTTSKSWWMESSLP